MRPSMEISLYSRVPYALLLNCASRIFSRLRAAFTRAQALMHFGCFGRRHAPDILHGVESFGQTRASKAHKSRRSM